VLAADRIDERYAQRVAGLAELVVVVTVEHGTTTTTEPLHEPPLTAEQWAALRGRGDLRFRSTAAALPMKAFARPLVGLDNRPVAALVVGLPESTLAPIEPADMSLYLILSGGVLVILWLVGGVAAWGLGRPPLVSGTRVAPPHHVPPPPALHEPDLVNGHTPSLSSTPNSVRQLPGLLIDHGRRLVESNGRSVTLTPTEFGLLWLLAAEPGQVVSRETLMEQLRGADWQAEPGLLDSHVSNLRRKIEPDPSRPRYVLTVRGVGYKLADATSQDT
jgi:DNA-binding winged helix-turn-helix (wHTH) protein